MPLSTARRSKNKSVSKPQIIGLGTGSSSQDKDSCEARTFDLHSILVTPPLQLVREAPLEGPAGGALPEPLIYARLKQKSIVDFGLIFHAGNFRVRGGEFTQRKSRLRKHVRYEGFPLYLEVF